MPTHFSALESREYLVPPTVRMNGRYVDNEVLSNFSRCSTPIRYRGITTHFVEVAYVAAKAPDAIVETRQGPIAFADHVGQLAAANPSLAKRLGRPKGRGGLINPRPDWDFVNISAMAMFLLTKFAPGTPERAQLDRMPGPLVEWNNWRDTRWGAHINGSRATGRNALGRLLTLLREDRLPTGFAEHDWAGIQPRLITAMNALRT